jgi:exonuclease VII small subunit
MDDHASADEPSVEEMSYTEASAELDAIVAFFEGREVDVDQLVGRLVRATAIIEELDKRLRRTRVQVEQLVPRLTAVLEETGDDEPAPAVPDHAPESGSADLTADAETTTGYRSPLPGDDVDEEGDGDDVDEEGDGDDGADEGAPGLF